mmetsp:Transcript_7453/g.9483  ORF Transcript_7453/g.9483 Transcript_7453/m.9483 type:complete len:841 (-) Transcript_7453:45-2567(-)
MVQRKQQRKEQRIKNQKYQKNDSKDNDEDCNVIAIDGNGDDDGYDSEIFILETFLNYVVCQALQFKTMKKNMIVPLILPSFPNHESYDYDAISTSSDNEIEIIAFFKLCHIGIQSKEMMVETNDSHNVKDDEKTEEENDYDDDDDDDTFIKELESILNNSCFQMCSMDDNVSNIVSLEIDLPQAENDVSSTSSTNHNRNDVEKEIYMDRNNINEKDSNKSPNYCPGYEELVQDIVQMANITIQSGSPTAVLLSGCKGVGKSRLASSVMKILTNDSTVVQMISAKDILLQASSSSTDVTELKQRIMSKYNTHASSHKQPILIMDDLDILLENENDTSSTHLLDERRTSLHAIIDCIDKLIARGRERFKSNEMQYRTNSTRHFKSRRFPFILGICCSHASNLPSSLHRIGRFEKIIAMMPPSEMQRQHILREMLHQLPILSEHENDDTSMCKLIHAWAAVLANQTAGCVASDLKRICIDGLTRSISRRSVDNSTKDDHDDDNDNKYLSIINYQEMLLEETEKGISWEDIKEAARTCIPSQLAYLDVTTSRDDDNEYFDISSKHSSNNRDTKDRFNFSWRNFGGYSEMKSKIYRAVFKPWCRRYSDNTDMRAMSALEKEIALPTGILFHGASGTGKTFAADCLANSLGLNVVKVRASDILDKWLGGSEATIRSIFARSRSAAPCLLLFDELDSIATNREDNDDGSTDVHSRILSTLLNEMDGVNSNRGKNDILVVGTTNRIHTIDAALLRPGRFEEHILLELPSPNEIIEIIKLHLSKAPLDEDIDFSDISKTLFERGVTGADIRGITTEACLEAIRHIDETTDVEEMTVKKKDVNAAIQSWK